MLKVAAETLDAFDRLLETVQTAAPGERVSRVAIRCQTDFSGRVSSGSSARDTGYTGRISRMLLRDYPQRVPTSGIVDVQLGDLTCDE